MSFALGTYEGIVYGLEIVTSDNKLSLKVKFAAESHINTVKTVAHSAVGHWMVSGGMDESIKIYNTQSMREFGILMKHHGTITCLKFFQDTFMLSGAEDGVIYVWSTEKWDCVAILKGHKAAVRDISIHPSGRIALSVGTDGAIRMWDLTEFKPVLAQMTESKNLSFIEWNPSGESYVVVQNGTVSDATISVYDANGKLARDIRVNARINCLAFVTSTWLATGEESGAVRIYDVQTGEVAHTLAGHEKRIRGLAPFVQENLSSPEASEVSEASPLPLLASASSDGTVQLWDLKSPQSPVATYKNPGFRITTLCSFRPMRVHFTPEPVREDCTYSSV